MSFAMWNQTSALLCLSFLTIFCSVKCKDSQDDDGKGRLIPVIIDIRVSTCVANNGYFGTCYPFFECLKRNGQISGSCAKGFGVCCTFTATCSQQVGQNTTYFQSQNYPNLASQTGTCSVSVPKLPNVCQLRLDFEDFKVGERDKVNGNCIADYFSVVGSSGTTPPILCGQVRQHMYLNFGTNSIMNLNMILGSTLSKWKIRIQMIPCNSIVQAPDGCLQYFYGSPQQRVEIIGYDPTSPPHLANLDYTLCVRREEGLQKIRWSVCQTNAFSMTGHMDTTGDAGEGLLCQTDYIQIFGRVTDNQGIFLENIFCGTRLNGMNSANDNSEILSSVKPFVIYVKTDGEELKEDDTSNMGFCLNYLQTA